MNPTQLNAIVELIDETRLLYNTFLQVLEQLHGDTGVSPPQRAVLEYLYRNGDATVPDIARARGVTRQHIQSIVNDLLEHGFVEQRPNPAHRRSQLVTLDPEGRSAIESTLDREQAFIARHLDDLDPEDVTRSAQTLARFRQLCERSEQ